MWKGDEKGKLGKPELRPGQEGGGQGMEDGSGGAGAG